MIPSISRTVSCLTAVAAAAALAGCADTAPVAPSVRPPGAPRAEILDAAHNGGTPGFYFLPPLVAQPNDDVATFDPTRSVRVSVCPLGNPAASACIAPAVDISPVQVDVNGSHYMVNWQTDAAAYPADSYYRLSVTDAADPGRVWGRIDVYLGASGQGFRGIDRTEFTPLLDGRTVPVMFRIHQGAEPPYAGGGDVTPT